jgi:hypothetical protein
MREVEKFLTLWVSRFTKTMSRDRDIYMTCCKVNLFAGQYIVRSNYGHHFYMTLDNENCDSASIHFVTL